jgi:hypothetical protein
MSLGWKTDQACFWLVKSARGFWWLGSCRSKVPYPLVYGLINID